MVAFILKNFTEQSKKTALFYKTIILFILLICINCVSYGQKSIKLIGSNNKTLMTIKENTRSKVKYFNNAEIEKVKGKLIILNDSQIMLDS
ncbi:MAG: hypothetical protein IT243_02635, partial [Bacteroidia bacterium]|nr:hypothetical protein [Bacteroidia bacterium]